MAALRAYTPLSALSLPAPSVLHPEACNPAMDLVALLSRAPSTKTVQGKGHAVTLWRLNGGPRVWTKDIGGWVEGLGWSPDGLRLALYVRNVVDDERTTLEIYSVHDGERLQSVDAPCVGSLSSSAKGKDREDQTEGRVKVDWSWTTEPAPALFGSGLSVIASLPFLQPHETPPAPAAHTFLPFARFGAAAAAPAKPSEPAYLKPSLPRLAHAVLPPLPLEAPRASLLTLTLAPPGEPPRSHPYLSGTFPLTPTPALAPLAIVASLALSSETHAFAEVATALEDLLRYLAVGIDHLREAWVGKNGGGTATREWITSIEEVLRQHGEDGDVRRALGDLLMTGRPGEGLMNFLGGRLTPRTLGRWESTVLGTLTTVRQTTAADLIPAAERVLILLKELHGWALWPERFAVHLGLEAKEIEQAIRVTTSLAHELITLERQVRDEHHRFSHFCLWLAYEVATAAANASQDSAEDDPLLEGKHNVLLVADYIQAGLLESDVDHFFNAEARPLTPSSLSTALDSTSSTSSTGLEPLLARLADAVARPASTSRAAGYLPGQDTSFAAGTTHALLKSPVLNRSRLRLPSPAKPPAPPPSAIEQSRRTPPPPPPNDDFDAMDESSVDMSMSMELDQTTSSTAVGGDGIPSSSPSLIIDPAPNVADEDVRPSELAQSTSEQPSSLPVIAEGLVGAVRQIVTRALPPQTATADSTVGDPLARLGLRDLGSLLRTRRVEGEPAQVALVVGDNGGPTLWLLRRITASDLETAAFALRVDHPGLVDVDAVEMVDLDFFTADELVLLLRAGTDEDARILLASVDLAALDWQQGPSPLVPGAVEASIRAGRPGTCPSLPLSRIRHLTSLDRLPSPQPPSSSAAVGDPKVPLPLASLALNGHRGRMTGSVLSWAGRELVVFDLAEDEEDEEGQDEEEEEEGGEMEE